jgi:hypothetical protein
MSYMSTTGQRVRIHEHTADQSCRWGVLFKPLAFIVLHDAQLFQHLVLSPHRNEQFDSSDYAGYARWLSQWGRNGMLNLLNVFLLVCDLRGVPSLPSITSRT